MFLLFLTIELTYFITKHEGAYKVKYNFDEVIDRKNTNCIKWDGLKDKFGDSNLLPLWVADSDFKCPQQVIDAIVKRAKHGIYGYTYHSPEFQIVTVDWVKNRHNWYIKKEWVTFSPGIVPALCVAIQTLTNPGDKVIIQSPVYFPFTEVIVNNGRYVVKNSLKFEDYRYTIDFKNLENKVKDSRVKLLILCNPHNPTGRVFSHDELKKIGEICIENNIVVIADEIHSDIVFKKYKHIPFASISKEFADNSLTAISPSKTFNIAGLQTSAIIIPNEKLMNLFQNQMANNRTIHFNVFGLTAFIASYKYGEEYLEKMINYLEGNIQYMKGYFEAKIPKIKFVMPEGTYLVWFDCRKLNMDKEELDNFFIKNARVALDSGFWFGEEGNGFMRINISCPRKILEEGLKRIEKAVNAL